MIERLVVHIGQHKTGTTALQQALHANRAALQAAGLCYPHLPGAARSDHRAVAFEFGAGDGRPFRPGPNWAAFSRLARASGAGTVVLSSEALVSLSGQKARQAVDAMSGLANAVDVLLYVRHPVHFANSAASTQMRIGATLEDFAAKPTLYAVRNVITRWARALTLSQVPGRLIVRPYQRDVDPAWNVVDDALTAIGHEGLGGAIQRSRPTPNPGLSALGVYLLDWINRHQAEEPLARASMGVFSHIEGPDYVLPDPVRAQIRKETRPLLRFLQETYGVELMERTEAATPCPLSDQELASLAAVVLATTQYGYEIQHSRIGHWFGIYAPLLQRPPQRHPVLKFLRATKLLWPLLGEHGKRARTVRRRLAEQEAQRNARSSGG